VGFLKLVISYRESEWQEAPETYPAEKCEALMHHVQPALIALLSELEALRVYPLLYVERIDAVGGRVNLRVVKFMGQFTQDVHLPSMHPAEVGEGQKWSVKRNRFFVGNREGVPQLDLHPFFILHRWELYVLARGSVTNLVEFESCSRGTRLRPPQEARSFYASFWERGVADRVNNEVPPILGTQEEWDDGLESVPPIEEDELFPFTWLNEEGREALEIALGESLRLGHFWLGVEFLLMALTRQSGCLLSDLLYKIGLSSDQVRARLRGMVGVATEDDWRVRDVYDLGARKFSSLELAKPKNLSRGLQTDGTRAPVITPRMMKILEDAKRLSSGGQITHVHLAIATLSDRHALPVRVFFGMAADAGWSQANIYKWVVNRPDIERKDFRL
jgi:hypothetical protein